MIEWNHWLGKSFSCIISSFVFASGNYSETVLITDSIFTAKIIRDKLNFNLLIVGYGKKKNYLNNYINENNLKKNVQIIPYQNNPFNLINSSDIFILTSIFEGLPNVLLEAQVLKKFIISSNCPTGPREILLNGKAGFLFKMKDHKSLAKIILRCVKNKKIMNNKIKIGYKNLDRFDYINNLNKYYQTVIKYL